MSVADRRVASRRITRRSRTRSVDTIAGTAFGTVLAVVIATASPAGAGRLDDYCSGDEFDDGSRLHDRFGASAVYNVGGNDHDSGWNGAIDDRGRRPERSITAPWHRHHQSPSTPHRDTGDRA